MFKRFVKHNPRQAPTLKQNVNMLGLNKFFNRNNNFNTVNATNAINAINAINATNDTKAEHKVVNNYGNISTNPKKRHLKTNIKKSKQPIFNNIFTDNKNYSLLFDNDKYKSYTLFENNDQKNFHEWIKNMKFSNFIPNCDNKILFVMCMWKRFDNLPLIVKSIANENKDVNLCIWNNNYEEKDKLINIVSNLKYKNVDINVYNSPENIRGIGRFVMTHYIINNFKQYEYVFFLDDDQYITNNFIERMLKMYNQYENSAVFWFSKIFNTNYIKNHHNPYWFPNAWCPIPTSRCPNHLFRTNKELHITKKIYNINYGGTGGCIYPTHVFKSDDIFLFNKKFRHIEDLLLSYLFKYKFNGKLISNGDNHDIVMSIKDKGENLEQHKKLYDIKNLLLKLLHSFYE